MHAFRVYKSTVLYCTVKNAFRVRTVPSESYGPAFYLAKGMSRESMPVSSSPPTPLKLHVHRPEYQALPNLKLHKSISIATFPPAIMLQTPYVVLVIILVHHCCKQILPLIRNKEGGGERKKKTENKRQSENSQSILCSLAFFVGFFLHSLPRHDVHCSDSAPGRTVKDEWPCIIHWCVWPVMLQYLSSKCKLSRRCWCG